MIDKLDFYHGAALARAIDHDDCQSIRKLDSGYLVNDRTLAFIKYTTKGRSPWQFTFSNDEIVRIRHLPDGVKGVVLALVCGGDGICAIPAKMAIALLNGSAGSISVTRKFRGWYGVSGPVGRLVRKVALNQWPEIAFQEEDGLDE